MVNLNNFNIETKKQVNIGNAKRTTLKLTLKNGKPDIQVQDLRDIVKGIEDNARGRDKQIQTMVRGLNIQKWNTLKSFDGELLVSEFEDYYGNKVLAEEKFEAFSQLEITVDVE